VAERSQALLNLDLYVAQHRRDPKGWEGVGTGYFRRNSLAFRCFSAWANAHASPSELKHRSRAFAHPTVL